MTFEEFQNYIKEHILDDWMEDAEVSISSVRKNNGVIYQGLHIREEGKTVSPSIYLDDFYDYYLNGEELGTILRRIREEYVWAMEKADSYQLNLSRFEYIKDRVIDRLVNYEKNKEILEDCPFIQLYDLAVTFRWLAHSDDVGISTSLITKQELDIWEISVHELLLAAQHNTRRIFPPRIMDLNALLLQMGKDLSEFEVLIPMYVMTNEQQINGATVLLYDNVIQQFAQQMNTSFYILPSSIHEVILVPAEEFDDPSGLVELVHMANHSIVELGDILSDSVYYYDLLEDRLSPVII